MIHSRVTVIAGEREFHAKVRFHRAAANGFDVAKRFAARFDAPYIDSSRLTRAPLTITQASAGLSANVVFRP